MNNPVQCLGSCISYPFQLVSPYCSVIHYVIGFLKSPQVKGRTSWVELAVNALSHYQNLTHLSVTCFSAIYIKVETIQRICCAQKGQVDKWTEGSKGRAMAGSVSGGVNWGCRHIEQNLK